MAHAAMHGAAVYLAGQFARVLIYLIALLPLDRSRPEQDPKS